MKPSKISYSESRESVNEIGLKSWRKAGVEIELGENDNVSIAYGEAKAMIFEALVAKEYGAIHKLNANAPLPTIDYSSKEKVEKAIEDAKTLEGLNKIMKEAFLNGFTEEFIAKKKKLQQ